MRYVSDGKQSYPVCSFCGIDETGRIGKVHEFGEQGVCDFCLETLAILLKTTGIWQKEEI